RPPPPSRTYYRREVRYHYDDHDGHKHKKKHKHKNWDD
ncbi:MAG: hypothetical protein H6R11_1382, partial [Proteobacteria bacterium]|nr:hypothetical protein [Pseudomonadota bacterium]